MQPSKASMSPAPVPVPVSSPVAPSSLRPTPSSSRSDHPDDETSSSTDAEKPSRRQAAARRATPSPASWWSQSSSKKPRRPGHTYRGHRRDSFRTMDIDVLTELRARQRTFDGAYMRTALSMLSYALLILKIFSPEFAKLGLVYIAVALAIMAIAFLRRNRLDHDFADAYRPRPAEPAGLLAPPAMPDRSASPPPPVSPTRAATRRLASSFAKLRRSLSPSRPAGPAPSTATAARIWGREFRTSGDAVVLLTLAVGALEVTLIVLIARL